MSPKGRPKKLKQLTLFQKPVPPSGKSPSKKRKSLKVDVMTNVAELSSSSDDLSRIQLSPAKTDTKTCLSDEESVVPLVNYSKKKRRVYTKTSSSSASDGMNASLEAPKSSEVQSTSETSQVDVKSPKKRRRLIRRISTEHCSSDENIAEEVDEERILSNRFRARGRQSTFQKNLEKLRRRKLKLAGNMVEEAESNDGQEESEPERNPYTTVAPFKGSKPSSAVRSDDEGSVSTDSSDFIVQDDNKVQLPPEFSMETHQDLSHQFKKIFQLFVHVAVQSAHKRRVFMDKQIQTVEYFSVPLQVMRRKLDGLRDSLVASSVWRPAFKRALENYPDFELIILDFAVPSCDACHLGGRLSTRLGRLSGSRYDRLGFEALEPLDDEQESKEFNLGRFCAKRTRVYHEFQHWEYALFQAIHREISELRQSSQSQGFHRVAYFGGKEPPTDLQDADGLCEWLDERRILETEWKRMNDLMESARHLEINDKRDYSSD